MKLTNDQRDKFEDLADELNGEIREEYSGRFMRNKTCLGIVVATLHKSLFKMGRLSVQEDFEMQLHKFEVDNMGKDYIIYFPHIES